MTLLLSGPHAGETRIVAGLKFVEGRLDLPDESVAARNVLVHFHGAVVEGEEGSAEDPEPVADPTGGQETTKAGKPSRKRKDK